MIFASSLSGYRAWIAVKGKTAELDMIYQEIYADRVLTYEIETFTDEGECEILYYR